MKTKVMSRVVLLVGWVLLMGVLVGCGKSTRAEMVGEGVSEAFNNTPITHTEVQSMEETIREESFQGYTVPVMAGINISADTEPEELGDFPFEIDLNGIDFLNPVGNADTNPEERPSVAYYFLRDRSRTVYEVCGEKRYSSAMKDIPDLVFTFFKEDPTMLAHDIYVGMGTFPNKGEDPPTVLELLALTEVDQLAFNEWRQALDATWNSGYADQYDAAVFKDSITEAVTKLAGITADKKILVVFGDSMLDFPGGETEWNTIMPTTDGTSPLTSILTNNTDKSSDDVQLHYVQYDCLPDDPSTRQVIRDNFWNNGISNWQLLQSQSDRQDINQIDDETLRVNDHIHVYGWKWYNSHIHQERVGANIYPERPPSWHVPSLLYGLIGDFRPAPYSQDGNLWQRYRFLMDPPATTMEIPIPGYANRVVIHMLGFDSGWCVNAGRRHDEQCEPTNRSNTALVYKTFDISLRAPSNSCEGTLIALNPDDYAFSALEYPALIWWEIPPMAFPALVGDINEVSYQYTGDTEVTVRSRTSLNLNLAWDGDLTPEEIDFLNHCYQVDIVPSGTTPDMSQGDYILPRTVTLTFDPGNDPALGFDLAFDVVVQRKINAPNFTDFPYVSSETEMLIGSEIGMPVVHFRFAPTLGEPTDFKLNESDISYTIPVKFTHPNYYPVGQSPPTPSISLLKRDDIPSNAVECMAPVRRDAQEFFYDEDRWKAKSIREGTGETHLLNGEIIEPNNSRQEFEITLNRSEVNECGYDLLLIDWRNDAFSPILCDLKRNHCEQISSFDAPDEGVVQTDDED